MVFQHFKATTMDTGTLKVKCIIGLDAFTYPCEKVLWSFEPIEPGLQNE